MMANLKELSITLILERLWIMGMMDYYLCDFAVRDIQLHSFMTFRPSKIYFW